MADRNQLLHALERTSNGLRDQSGKTLLDQFIETAKAETGNARAQTDAMIAQLLPELARTNQRQLRWARELVRRLGIRDRTLATALQRILADRSIPIDIEGRKWISLSLMDLGFPRTVAALRSETEMRRAFIGDWLSMIAANDNYVDVKSAFLDAVRDRLVSIKQLCLKSEVVRRQFGDRLADFLKAMAAVIPSSTDRQTFERLVAQMYGMSIADVGSTTRTPEVTPVERWVDPRTVALLDRIAAETSQRRAA